MYRSSLRCLSLIHIFSGQDISLEPQWGDEITELVHAQNIFAWPVKIFQKQTLKNTTLVDYDKDKLQAQIDALDCMDADKQTAPENASVSSYDKTEGFTVVGCVMGTTIDAEKMYQAVQELSLIHISSTISPTYIICIS